MMVRAVREAEFWGGVSLDVADRLRQSGVEAAGAGATLIISCWSAPAVVRAVRLAELLSGMRRPRL